MISIIIPVYNSAETLPGTLDSVLIQNNQDFEIILIDDGSTDNSRAICEEYVVRSNKIHYFPIPNGGPGNARNIGLEKAAGEWITFIDSDDLIEKDYLSINYNSDAELQMQNWVVFGGDVMRFEHLDKGYIHDTEIKEFLSGRMQMNVFRMISCKFYKKSIIADKQIRFPTDFRVGEDTLFMLEYIKYVKSINVVDSGKYLYFRHSDWIQKYSIDIDNALSFIDAFYERYNNQPYACWRLLDLMTDWYPNVIANFHNPEVWVKWFSSKTIFHAQVRLIFHKGKRYFLRFCKNQLRVLLLAVNHKVKKCFKTNIV